MSTAPRSPDGFPIDVNGFIRQCAWCRRVADEHGRFRIISATLIHGASHGCCEACEIRFLSPGASGVA
jgi:hypothetical protein